MTSPDKPPAPMGRALRAFAIWLAVLAAALAVEGTSFGRVFFHSKVAVTVYLVLQGIAYVIALWMCGVVLLRGTGRQRAIVTVPVLLLLLYGAVALGGPG